MNSKNFSDAMSLLDNKYVDETINYKRKVKKSVLIKCGAIAAACLAIACVAMIHFTKNNSDDYIASTPGIADAAPMIYVNDVLYKQSPSQTSYSELKNDFVYLGVIESDVTNLQDTVSDGVPKENFQANHPVVGAAVYQCGDNIVVEIEGRYWLYENTNDSTKNQHGELSEEEKKLLDPTYGID